MATELSLTTVGLDEVDPAEWDALVDGLPRPTPFLLHGWLHAWASRYGRGHELAVAVARRGRRIAAALPLQLRRRAGVTVAEFVGGRHAQLAEVLLAPGEQPSLAGELMRLVDADVFALAGLPSETPLAPDLRLIVRSEAPVVDLGGGWDELYRARLSSKRRSQHRKRLRDLEQAGRLELRVSSDERALEEALRLHALRWRGRRDASTYGLPGAADFHRAVLHALGERARIATLQLDGRAIAFRYGVRVGDSLVGNGIGFDPAFARFSPGWVLMLEALERAAAEGVRRVELLGGDEQYKLQLAEPAPLHEGLAAGSLAGRAIVEARAGAVAARRRLKRSALLRRLYLERPWRRSTAEA